MYILESNQINPLKTVTPELAKIHKDKTPPVRKKKKKTKKLSTTLPAMGTLHNRRSEMDFCGAPITVFPDTNGWTNSPARNYWKPWSTPQTVYPGPDQSVNGGPSSKRK